MEHLKECKTNAQAIGGFQALSFQAYTITRAPDVDPGSYAWGTSDDLRAAEAELREKSCFVIQDAVQPWLWLFQAGQVSRPIQEPLEAPTSDAFHFERVRWGVMKASELARPPMRSTGHPQSSTGSMSSPLTLGSTSGLHIDSRQRQQQGISQPSGHSEQQTQHEPSVVYELFLASIIALLSYNLVKHHNFVTLNYRTLVLGPSTSLGNAAAPSPDTNAQCCVASIDAAWTSSGTVLISMACTIASRLRSLNYASSTAKFFELVGQCIRIAPNGDVAQIVSLDGAAILQHDGGHSHAPRKRAKTATFQRSIERWKASVKQWLLWKGYTNIALDGHADEAWVRVRLARSSRSTAGRLDRHAMSRDILWPRSLCFCYDSPVSTRLSLDSPSRTSSDDALRWFDLLDGRGFQNPLDVAQLWFQDKSNRDRAAEARRRSKNQDEETVRMKDEVGGLMPSSPFTIRPGLYGDTHPAGGVYPTPPDGVLPGTTNPGVDAPSGSAGTVNVILAPGGTTPAINLSTPHDNAPTQDAEIPPTSPDFLLPDDPYNVNGGSDDLFEDLDEMDYEGNGVTDADFNFFDEPGQKDDDMPDTLPADNSENASKASAIASRNVVHKDDRSHKTEVPDPMLALEHALEKASAEAVADGEHYREVPVHDEKDVLQGPTSQARDTGTAGITSPNSEVLATASVSPRFNPHFVQKSLLPPLAKDQPKADSDLLLASNASSDDFGSLHFDQKLSLADAKYHRGRFMFAVGNDDTTKEKTHATTHQAKSTQGLPLLSKLRHALGTISSRDRSGFVPAVPDDSDLSDTSNELQSLVIESDEESSAPESPVPLAPASVLPLKRKLPKENVATPGSLTSIAGSLASDHLDVVPLLTDVTVLPSMDPSLSDWSLRNTTTLAPIVNGASRYTLPSLSPLVSSAPATPISPPETTMDIIEERTATPKDTIAIAQILTDQVVSSTLELLDLSMPGGADGASCHLLNQDRCTRCVHEVLPNAAECSVATLTAVHDVFPDLPIHTKGPQRAPPRKANETLALPGHHVYQINPPYLRFRRADTMWELLPPAIAFWDPLGLCPCSPAKNITAFAICPDNEALIDCAKGFFRSLAITYDSCRLGSHNFRPTKVGFEDGIVPWRVKTKPSLRALTKALRDTCVQLGKLLASNYTQIVEGDVKTDAFVIYIVNPFEDSTLIWELCAAFWMMFQTYSPGRFEQVQKPDLVLQIVPIRYIASSQASVMTDASTFSQLAREVYDRSPPNSPCDDSSPLNIYTAPSFQLDEPLPRSIPFKLNPDPSPDLLHENSYMHLGYTISLDGAWITAAWTDISGKSQAIVSYHLGSRAFGEIAKEIWQTTVDTLRARRVTWRVCIARSGVMEREEMEAWVFLVSCPTQLNLFITLLAVSTEPNLSFTPPLPHSSSSTTINNFGQPLANTPGSTPQPGVSPEHELTPAATPSAEGAPDPMTDPDARLVDSTDETWGIILAHRLHNTNSTTEFRPALISGLLAKRGPLPSSSTTGPLLLTVNILWMGAVNPTRAATSPFPTGADGISPGGSLGGPSAGIGTTATGSGPGFGQQERNYSSLTWTPTVQTRAAAENLLKEVLGQYRGLGLLARLRGMKGTKHGIIPWHIVAAKRGVEGLGKCGANIIFTG